MLASDEERLVRQHLQRRDLEPVLLLAALLVILVALAVLLGSSSPSV